MMMGGNVVFASPNESITLPLHKIIPKGSFIV